MYLPCIRQYYCLLSVDIAIKVNSFLKPSLTGYWSSWSNKILEELVAAVFRKTWALTMDCNNRNYVLETNLVGGKMHCLILFVCFGHIANIMWFIDTTKY